MERHQGEQVRGGHSPNERRVNSRRLKITLGLVLVYMVAEIIGGLWTNSLALLADASHMGTDAAALGLSLFAVWIAQRPATPHKTFGYYRAEILAALVNGVALVVVAIYIFVEAYQRLILPPAVQGLDVMVIAAGGLVVNIISLRILGNGKSESLNVRGAWLHVFTDALGSSGAILAGLLVWRLEWNWADPALAVLIGLLVMYSSWSLLKESVSVLMESAPGDIDVDQVRNSIRSVPGVLAIHDLHVWMISSGIVSMSAHVVAAENQVKSVVEDISRMVRERFDINHTTIQIETPEGCIGCEGIAHR
jgi:cation diffusion facilitator family transporter